MELSRSSLFQNLVWVSMSRSSPSFEILSCGVPRSTERSRLFKKLTGFRTNNSSNLHKYPESDFSDKISIQKRFQVDVRKSSIRTTYSNSCCTLASFPRVCSASFVLRIPSSCGPLY